MFKIFKICVLALACPLLIPAVVEKRGESDGI